MSSDMQLRFFTAYSRFSLDVNLTLPGKGVTALFGPSGSGKTTLLRCIAGLEKTHVGEMRINGDVWQSQDTFLPLEKRPLSYVFQDAGLLPHLTVQGNLDYTSKRCKQRNCEPLSAERRDYIVGLLGIAHILKRRPERLSGGERQRAAIARALIANPQVLLMDEPLSALDQDRRQEILPYLEKLRSEFSGPIIYVSHATDEVTRLADHLVTLENGRVTRSGPLDKMLADLDAPLHLGEESGVVMQGVVEEIASEWHMVRVNVGDVSMWIQNKGFALGDTLRLRVLARDVSLALEQHKDTSIVNILPCIVEEIRDDERQGLMLVRLRLAGPGGTPLLVRLTRLSVKQLWLGPGLRLWAQIKSVALVY